MTVAEHWPSRLDGTTIGFPCDLDCWDLEADVRIAFRDAISHLTGLGATCVAVPAYDFSPLFNVAETIIKCEAATMHRSWLEQRPDQYSSQVRRRIEAGLFIPATDYLDAMRLRAQRTTEFLEQVLSSVDYYVLPTVRATAPKVAQSDPDDESDQLRTANSSLSRLTRPFNLLGLPAVTVPCGTDGRGLPMGLQFVGHPFADMNVLAACQAFMSTATESPEAA